jgi:hypothetical protein
MQETPERPPVPTVQKNSWVWPFNHFQEEWPEVRNAIWSFVLCVIASLVIGAAVVYFLFSAVILPSKDATIQLLQQQLQAKISPTSLPITNIRYLPATNFLTATNFVQQSTPAINPISNSGNNNQSGGVTVQSFNQQGGITAQTVIITNGAGAVFKASVEISIDEQNKPQGGKYITTGNVHLISPYPVGKLYIIAIGNSVENSPRNFGLDVSPKGGGVSAEIRGRNDNASYVILQNAFGDYDLRVTTTNQEQIKFEWYVQ